MPGYRIACLAAAAVMTAAVLCLLLWNFFRVPGGSRRERTAREITLIPVAGHMESAEWLLRSAAARRNPGETVLAVDFGADAETRVVIGRLCGELAGLRLVSAEELEAVLRQALHTGAPEEGEYEVAIEK